MEQTINQEFDYQGRLTNGFKMVAVMTVIAVVAALSWVLPQETFLPLQYSLTVLAVIAEIVLLCGFFVQQPNEARVMIFFGQYRGTYRRVGFFWVNPFMGFKKISLRLHNMDVQPIKVNDKIGNPVMIGMVLVWKVNNTYRAFFDVDAPEPAVQVDSKGNFTQVTNRRGRALETFVRIQSDAALREVTGHYAYDNVESHDEITLRSGGREISEQLERKINERLNMAGIEVIEARLNYLAYAPEIAAVMLRRQQAAAIISAREKIVEGAVSMVKMALSQLEEEQVVTLDDERKAAMVSNLLVVLCGDEPAQPVVNTGTLYN